MFFGRKEELYSLKELTRKKSASLVVIKGRRRIGKSRLIEEFGASIKGAVCTFSGLAPTESVSAQMERADFARQMKREIGIPGLENLDDWGDLFWHLASQTKKGRVLIVFDEINWMGSKDPTFLPKLKTAWDLYFKNNPQLILILSGSMSAWIEGNIVSSSGFLGRISLDMTLRELPLSSCGHFWHEKENYVSAYEKFKVLSVIGGVPRYLEEVNPKWSAEKNIQTLCFQKEALLFKEFERIFNDLFARKGDVYRTILQRLAKGDATLSDIAGSLGVKKGGSLSLYLDNLVLSEYVAKDETWHIGSGKVSKLSRYRLKDNYIRFYLKYIEPVKGLIDRGNEVRLPGTESIMGLAFENLVLSNRKSLLRQLHIKETDIMNENPFLQQKTKIQEGCQIDYMVQTTFQTLYVCEIKFSKEKIGMDVIKDVEKKCHALKRGKGFSIHPVLIHVNGVTEGVEKSGFFSSIVDFGILFDED